MISPALVLVEAGAGGPSAALPVSESIAAPGLDFALLHSNFTGPDASFGGPASSGAPPRNVLDLGVVPVPFSATASAEIGIGDAIEVAGYGLTESASANELRFLVETVVSSDATSERHDLASTGHGC